VEVEGGVLEELWRGTVYSVPGTRTIDRDHLTLLAHNFRVPVRSYVSAISA
jgi:hypothetical protein